MKRVTARLATYLQLPGYGEGLVRANSWGPEVLRGFRAEPVVAGFRDSFIDHVADTAALEHIANLLPDEWTTPAAYGTPEQCAAEVHRQLELGATGWHADQRRMERGGWWCRRAQPAIEVGRRNSFRTPAPKSLAIPTKRLKEQ